MAEVNGNNSSGELDQTPNAEITAIVAADNEPFKTKNQSTTTSLQDNDPTDILSAEGLETTGKLVQLPLQRIRNLMKLDSDVQVISNETTFMIARATELFIQSLTRESNLHRLSAKRKIIQKTDLISAISSVECLMFLDGVLDDN